MPTATESVYNRFWRFLGEISQPRPMTQQAHVKYRSDLAIERFRTMKREMSTVNEFFGDAKKVLDALGAAGADVQRARNFVAGLAKPIQVMNSALDATAEAVAAAESVSRTLAAWYYQAESTCRNQAGGDEDQATICSAAVVRTWQARNVRVVLGSQPDSFVSQLWPKWRRRLLMLIL